MERKRLIYLAKIGAEALIKETKKNIKKADKKWGIFAEEFSESYRERIRLIEQDIRILNEEYSKAKLNNPNT